MSTLSKPTFLSSSLDHLTKITTRTHNEQIKPVALQLWQHHLQTDNPLWKHIAARPFSVDSPSGSAHVMAIYDQRLPRLGLLGYFACTDSTSGSTVIQQAKAHLHEKFGLHDYYGPINGTITSDYRFNLKEDVFFPGEPVNPTFYIDAFTKAGFTTYNKYVSGISHHYSLFVRFLTRKPAEQDLKDIVIRPFDIDHQLQDLQQYHKLMNAIFPSNSIYCPEITFEEREYNIATKNPVFNPRYTFFLQKKRKPIGFIVAFPYQNQMILKTIGLLPEYRGKRLSSLLIKKIHNQAAGDGLTHAIYATIRVGNRVYKMRRPGVKIFRNYISLHASM